MKEYIVRRIKSKRIDTKGNTKYNYEYLDKNNKSIDKSVAKRLLEGLYIPPAYNDVKINLNQLEKVLAIGYDEKGRPQYIYNDRYKKRRENTKFKHMIEFGDSYKKIYNQIKRDLYTEGDNKHKQIAMALMLVIDCGIRIRSEKYRDENNSFGATTLEPRHIKIKGEVVTVNFIGKKGVINTGKSRSKRLSKNLRIKKRTFKKDEPIFSYRRGEKWYTLKSADVNRYLKKFGNFTSKNFRTWVANLGFITELLKNDKKSSENEKKKHIQGALQKTAEKLNNTSTVCKKNYIDPFIVDLYLTDTKRFFATFKNTTTKEEISEKYIELLKSR